jgi:hypothetical protein
MRCFVCRALLVGAVGFTLIFMIQEQIDLIGAYQTLSSAAVLIALGGVVLIIWTHFAQWRRPLIIFGLLLLGATAVAAVVLLPGLQDLLGQLLRGISFEGRLPLVFAVMCLIAYGVIGIARAPTSTS